MQSVLKFNGASVLVALFFIFSTSISFGANNEPNLVALFGDSISFGFNQAFPSREDGLGRLNRGVPSIFLNEILRDNNRDSLVSNLGVGGSASGPSANPNLFSNNGVLRINSDLAFVRSTYAPTKAQYALIMYGTNDYAYSISSTTTGFNNRILIEEATNEGFIPVVGTIPPCACNNVIPVNNSIRQAVSFQQSQGFEVYLVDHYVNLLPNWPSLVDPDGVHPNNAGYQTIAEFWYDNRLESLIERDKTIINGALLLLLDD